MRNRSVHRQLAKNAISGAVSLLWRDSMLVYSPVCCSVATLGTLPDTMGTLKHLTMLSVPFNQLSGPLPSWLANLRLQDVILGHNQVGCHPPSKHVGVPRQFGCPEGCTLGMLSTLSISSTVQRLPDGFSEQLATNTHYGRLAQSSLWYLADQVRGRTEGAVIFDT